MGVGFEATLMSHGRKITDFGKHTYNIPRLRVSKVSMNDVHVPLVKAHGMGGGGLKSIKPGRLDFGRGINVDDHLNRAWTTIKNT